MHKTTGPALFCGLSLEDLSSLRQEGKCDTGAFGGVFGFETGVTSGVERVFVCLFVWGRGTGGGGGVLRKQIRIKEFNPRLIYFHYLQD